MGLVGIMNGDSFELSSLMARLTTLAAKTWLEIADALVL